MNSLEAAQKVEKLMEYDSLRGDYKDALQVALEALRGNPCAVCVYSPPTAGDGRPCTVCPAVGAVEYK